MEGRAGKETDGLTDLLTEKQIEGLMEGRESGHRESLPSRTNRFVDLLTDGEADIGTNGATDEQA